MKNYAWITFFMLLVWGSAASAERLAVSVSIANIRSGPGRAYGILWQRKNIILWTYFKSQGNGTTFVILKEMKGGLIKRFLVTSPQ